MPPVTLTRREAALGLVASAMALAACDKPEEEIVPHVEDPAGLLPGVARRYATTLPFGGHGLLATSIDGRPVKLEGNPRHPASQGATDVFAEAALLGLYDPDRSRAVHGPAGIASWEGFLAELAPRLSAARATGGAGLYLLTGEIASPTLLRLLGAVRARYPGLSWHVHEPIGAEQARAGAVMAFGRPVTVLPRLERAAVVLALDADPLGPGPDQIRHARAFAQRRTARAATGAAGFARLYAVEPVMTVTGAKADHRLTASPADIRAVALALARGLGAELPEPALDEAQRRFVAAVLADLTAHRGEAVILTGEWQPPELHALVHWLNARLDAPVDHLEPVGPAERPATLADLRTALVAGQVETLLIAGTNPAYDAPADLDLATALTASRAFSVQLGTHRDETAALCRWHLPESHPFEDWGDWRATDGTVGLAQPLIRPLYDTRGLAWLLGRLLDAPAPDAHAAVRATWQPAADGEFERWWRQVLRDGIVPDTAAPPAAVPAPGLPSLPEASTGPSLLLRPDPTLWDGRFADNAWLQECPKPLTRQVWGNALLIAPELADRLGVADGDIVRVGTGGRTIEAPVLRQAGTAMDVAVLTLGHGRRRAGAIGDGVGVDAYPLRRSDALWQLDGITLAPTGEQAPVHRLQEAHRLDGEARELFRTASLAELAGPPATPERPPSFYEPPAGDGPAWGMVIDTTLCIGCNACVVACQAENNVPVVGPEEVDRGRDMHWLRIDTYDVGTAEQPRPGFQPVPCMHCELAPCEPVCPVAASVHDAEGLNVQVYNRCIGTRFCQSNCPYKVRRFNFYGYGDGQEYANQGAPVLAAQRNPEVTVRARGVMEKCTYCTQRISAARRAAEREDRPLRDGEVVTACQSACPAGAIRFGDLKAQNSATAALKAEPQHYALLGHLGTRPRTTYLAAVHNHNPALGDEPA